MSRAAVPPGGRVAAFVDLGTNSVRLLIVRLDENGSYTVLTRQKETVRLGEGEFETGRLQPAAMERTALVCKNLMEAAKGFQADDVVAVATSATREAENREEFLALMKEQAGVEIRVIAGLEEARLIHLGVGSGEDTAGREAVFIDIGGGSTEISVGSHDAPRHRASLKLGAIRLSALFRPEEDGRISQETYDAMRTYALDAVRPALDGFGDIGTDLAFGSSGTIENLAAIAGDKTLLTYTGLCTVLKKLCPMSLEERRQVLSINPGRADIIVGGGAILEALMAEIGIPAIRVSDRGVIDGLLVDYLSGFEGFLQGSPVPLRRQGVIHLMRTCRSDEGHAHEVARLALRLFDTGALAGVHTLGEKERELLEYAALLHDTGKIISFRNHQHHSSYIIENAGMPGFSRREIRIIGETARFHRKKTPSEKALIAAGLDRKSSAAVRILSALLRIAENLDRSHRNLVTDAVLKIEGDRVVIEIPGGCDLEVWGVRDALPAVEKCLGRRAKIRIV
ncbi:MAG: exopolyphosphatase / guanosine-5-triphosphate,3-diphosphate pyrophosphatase [Methanofollis sp.]|nr:exopolyphosphatase / guanosine-5-triphosphate,3-diphosphate pyrophosphatase [Methanofollis sp.]